MALCIFYFFIYWKMGNKKAKSALLCFCWRTMGGLSNFISILNFKQRLIFH